MVTERSTARRAGTRCRIPLWSRLLWLGALLFGLLYTHALHGDSSAGHIAPGHLAASTAHVHDQPAASVDDHEGEGDPTHTLQDCATGQPPAAVDIAPPAMSPLTATDTPAVTARSAAPATVTRLRAPTGPASAVLRV